MIRCHPDVFDLRAAFALALGSMAAAPDDPPSPPAAGAGVVAAPGDTTANAPAEEEGEDNDDEEFVLNPRLKEVSNEAAKYRRQRNEANERAVAAEARVKE